MLRILGSIYLYQIYNLTERVTNIITYLDPSTFNLLSSPVSVGWRGAAYGNDTWVLMGADNPGTIISSEDGINWTERPHAITQNLRWVDVVYGGGQFVAVAEEGVRIGTSPDGINWTEQTPAVGAQLSTAITYGNGVYVIVETVNQYVQWSHDAINWTRVAVVGGGLNVKRTIGFGDGKFVIPAGSETFTSTDGSTWSTSSSSLFAQWGITYGNGTFVTVSTSGETYNSTNGITWYPGTAASGDDYYEVIYGNGTFVATGGNAIMASNDGSTWQAVSAPAASTWYSLAFGSNRFISGSASGDIMSSFRVEFEIDPDFMSFNSGDIVNMVLFDKRTYSATDQTEANIISINGNIIELDAALPAPWLFDNSTNIYLRNITERSIYRELDASSNSISMDPSNHVADPSSGNGIYTDYCIINVSDYTFTENQLVSVLIRDVCTGLEYGASYRILDVSTSATSKGYAHAINGQLPQFTIDNSTRYSITARHAFGDYYSTQLTVNTAYDVSNNFYVYNNDPYYTQNYMDNTFTYVNSPFDQEVVLDQWGTVIDVSAPIYYQYGKPITADVSSLIIFDAVYDDPNYMLNQKNIWTIRNIDNNELTMKVWNDNVIYTFNEVGQYNIKGEAYDSYGNLKSRIFDGMVNIV